MLLHTMTRDAVRHVMRVSGKMSDIETDCIDIQLALSVRQDTEWAEARHVIRRILVSSVAFASIRVLKCWLDSGPALAGYIAQHFGDGSREFLKVSSRYWAIDAG